MNDQFKKECYEYLKKELNEIIPSFPTGATGNDALRQVFPYWCVKHFFGIEDDSDIKEIIKVDGSNDKGMDFFVVINSDGTISTDSEDDEDAADKTIIYGQCKLGNEMYNEVYDESDLTKTLGIEELLNETDQQLERLGANDQFRKHAKTFKEYTKVGQSGTWRGRVKACVFAAGSIQPAAKNKMQPGSSYIRNNFSDLYSGNRDFEYYDIDKILHSMVLPETPDLKVTFFEEPIKKYDFYDIDPDTIGPEHPKHESNGGVCDCKQKGNLSLVGHISANELRELHDGDEGVGDTIFLENPRRFLGDKKPTFKAMSATLSNPGKPTGKLRFWKFNNGITATCDKIKEVDDPPHTYLIKNMKIVNGQQTTGVFIHKDNLVYMDNENIQIGIKIHASTDENERKAISQSTNRQNALDEHVMMEIDDEHKKLFTQCRNEFPKYYYENQLARFDAEPDALQNEISQRRVLKKAKTAVIFYAYNVDPQRAIFCGVGKIFQEWNNHDYRLVYFNEPNTIPEKIVGSVTYQEQRYGPVEQPKPRDGVEPTHGLAGNSNPEGIRSVKELIIVHIFQKLLEDFNTRSTSLTKKYKKWLVEGSGNQQELDEIINDDLWNGTPTPETNSNFEDKQERLSNMTGKAHIQYFVLNWIKHIMDDFDEQKRIKIEDKIIEEFGSVIHNDKIPVSLAKIAKLSWDSFISAYDWNRTEQWFGMSRYPDEEKMMKYLKKTDGLQKRLLGYREQNIQSLKNNNPQATYVEPIMVHLDNLVN